ncbi:MAG: T9SS type A sorting domain-containing protein, partial [Saprospiraceae bacterium]|nr:T9SS type A sorting domain-containing protein [Saprospiraceae bacterium]
GIVIDDAFLSGGPLEPKEFITGNQRYHLDYMDQILFVDELTSSFAYHEGLDGTMYQISNGIFLNYNGGIPGSIEIGEYDKLYNDPYSNHFVELEGNILIRHAYEDYSSQGTNELLFAPIEVQFIENGIYYLYETESMYTIAFYSYADSSSEVFYELAKTDEVDHFHISDFEVVEDEIYFLGVYVSPLNQGPYSYVQKRSLTKNFEPIRKDLELTFASVYGEPVNDYGLYDYDYSCTVTNTSMDTIHHFSVYSSGMDVTIGDKFYIQKDLPITLAPGESHEFEGEFTYYGLAYITFHIVGVDFGLDRDISNNTYVADVTTSVKKLDINQFAVGPNPCTNVLSISGNINDIHSLTIQSISGQQLLSKESSNGTIDVSSLPPGQYWLHINSVHGSEVEKFIKH